MPELLGQYFHTIDQKNRLSVPSKLRMLLGDSFVLCLPPNGDRCIFAYSNENWEELMKRLCLLYTSEAETVLSGPTVASRF